MLIGEYDTKVTDKNRLALPKKFREELSQDLIIMQGYEGCVILVTKDQFIALTNEITNGHFINDAIRDTSRFLIGSAHEVTLDKQGRFILPQSLKSFSKISDEVTFLGLVRWIEIWSKKSWDKRKIQISKDSSKIASKLNEEFSGRRANA